MVQTTPWAILCQEQIVPEQESAPVRVLPQAEPARAAAVLTPTHSAIAEQGKILLIKLFCK